MPANTQPHDDNPFEHRAKFGSQLDVRELAQTLRHKNPIEVDAWVREHVEDMDDVRALFALLIRYIVARGL